MTRVKILEIFAAIFIVGGVVALIYLWTASTLGTSDKVGCTMAISTIELVIVTGIYAWHTRKMAEEMREQRLTVSQPLVLPDFSNYRFPEIPKILFANLGNGPALNVKVTFAYAKTDLVEKEWKSRKSPSYSVADIDESNWTIIKASSQIECTPYLADEPNNIGTAFVEYSDIYGRSFLTGWGYRCDRDSRGCIILQPTDPIYPIIRE